MCKQGTQTAGGEPDREFPMFARFGRALLIWAAIQVVVIATSAAGTYLISEIYNDVSDVISVVFFGVCTSVSVVSSWMTAPRIVGNRPHWIIHVSLAAALAVGLAVNPILIFTTPVFVEESIGYYLVIAVLGFIIIVGQFALSLRDIAELAFRSRAKRESRAPDSPLELTEELRNRARAYRVESRVSIGTILVALLGGAAIFVGADTIAAMNFDQRLRSATNDVVRAQSALEEVASVVDELKGYSDVVSAINASKAELSEYLGYGSDARLAEIERQLAGIEDIEIDEGSSRLYAELIRSIEMADSRMRFVIGYRPADGELSVIEAKLKEIIDARAEDDALRTILSSLSTRFGAVILVVFLVRILTAHFRYSSRMVSHYESRAYILQREGDADVDLKELLSPDDINYEKMQRVPTSDIGDIVRKTVEALKS